MELLSLAGMLPCPKHFALVKDSYFAQASQKR